MLYVYNNRNSNLVTHTYQLVEEPEKDPTASIKCEIGGKVRAISGKGVSWW